MANQRSRIRTGVIALILVAASLYARYEILSVQKQNDHEAWQFDRSWEMRSERTSWLSLAGLFWLEEGTSSIGFSEENDFYIRDRKGPDFLGMFDRRQDSVFFEPSEDIVIKLHNEPVSGRIYLEAQMGEEEGIPKLQYQNITWWVIVRDGQLGVRVWDSESIDRKEFKGISSYDFDLDWQVEARFVPYKETQEFTYPTVIGTTRTETSPGLLVFQHENRQYEMIPFERREGTKLFLVFGDQTNGTDTYGGGRFMYVDKPDESGFTVIDFNKAYNPPCAFSDYSTCPQPLKQNRLPIQVNAGEKKYRG